MGGLTGSSLLGFAAGAGSRAISGQKVNLLTLGMDFAGAWGGTQVGENWDSWFGGPAGMAGDAAAPGLGGDIVAGMGGGAPAGPVASTAVAPAANAAGVTSSPKGLLSGVLDSKWLHNPVVGHALLGVGQGLAAPDPEDAYAAQYKYGKKADEDRQKRIAANYRRVAPPSDRRMRA